MHGNRGKLGAGDVSANDGIKPPPEERAFPEEAEHLLPLVAEFGVLRLRTGSDTVAERVAALRGFCQHVAGSASPNSVFVDTTTLHAAWSLVGSGGDEPLGRPLTAMTLLDLDTFVRCAVLFDSIFYLRSKYIDEYEFNERLGNEPVVIGLPVDPEDADRRGVAAALVDIYYTTRADVNWLYRAKPEDAEYQDLHAVLAAWEKFTGRQLSAEDLKNGERERDHTWSSEAPELLKKLVAADLALSGSHLEDSLHWLELIDECNVRSLFNQRVAGMLNLTYVPNVARLPFRDHQLAFAAVAHERFLDLDIVQQALRDRAKVYMRPRSVQVPILLTAVLARCSSLAGFLDEVAALRQQAAPYRKRRRELLEAIRQGRAKDCERLAAAALRESTAWRSAALTAMCVGTTAVLAAAGQGVAAWTATALTLLRVATQERSMDRDALLGRLLRPEEWFITSVGATARELTNALPAVQRLWDADEPVMTRLEARLPQVAELVVGSALPK